METATLFFLFLFSLCLYICFLYSQFQPNSTKTYPIVRALPEFLKNRHRFLDWTTEVLRDCPSHTIVFNHPGKVHAVVTASPENVKHILNDNFDNYPKGDRFLSVLEDFLGRGIFNIDGESWRLQRKIASHEFTARSLRNFIMENVQIEISTRLIPLLERASKSNQQVDLQAILERFAFDNICKLAFNVDPGCLNAGGISESVSGFMKAFEEATTLITGRFLHAAPLLWKINKFFIFGEEKPLQRSIKIVHEFADEIIRSRLAKRTENQNSDILSRFIQNDDSNSPEFLRDVVISFILAGRDTTSAGLSWFFWLLASNPRVETNIIKELESIREKFPKSTRKSGNYSFEELKQMNYLQAAISESMRLYPPVPMDIKSCKSNDIFPDGTFVGKNWSVTYHAYAMGRMESIWGKDCEEFFPERWLNEEGTYKQENPFKYPVFQAGPRMCLGKDMAYIQMKSIAAILIERFKIDVLEKEKRPEYSMAMTLRMKDGLQIKVKERLGAVVEPGLELR